MEGRDENENQRWKEVPKMQVLKSLKLFDEKNH